MVKEKDYHVSGSVSLLFSAFSLCFCRSFCFFALLNLQKRNDEEYSLYVGMCVGSLSFRLFVEE